MHIRSKKAVRTCVSLVQIVKRELPTREQVYVLKFYRVDCVTIHMTSLPAKISLCLLSRHRYAGRDNYRKVYSSFFDFCRKIAETVRFPLMVSRSLYCSCTIFLSRPQLSQKNLLNNPNTKEEQNGQRGSRMKIKR